jgi:hypothetical protein
LRLSESDDHDHDYDCDRDRDQSDDQSADSVDHADELPEPDYRFLGIDCTCVQKSESKGELQIFSLENDMLFHDLRAES